MPCVLFTGMEWRPLPFKGGATGTPLAFPWLAGWIVGEATGPFGGGIFLLGSSAGGEATGPLSVPWPVGGVWDDEGDLPLMRGEGAGCVE